MSNDFDSESLNLGVQPVQYYVDNDGSLKFISEYISSSNFNGTIPVVSTTISASSIVPGMYISVTGSGVNSQYYPVVSISVDDPELEDTPSQSMTVTYIDGENIAENIYLDQLDLVDVKYENWDEKDLGTSGWGITSGGNAIFSNVAVRGRIEATEGEISGDLTLGGSLTASNSGGYLTISSSGIFGYTSSGLFHLDNINGEMSFTGDITANSGKVKKLTIGAGKSYPIVSLTGTASVKYGERDSGNFILTVDPNSKNFSPGDYFYLAGVKTSGSAFIIDNGTGLNSPIDPAGFFTNLSLNSDGSWNNTYVYQIITASYLSGSPQYDKYFCRLQQGLVASNYDFSQVTGTSGSMNFGYVYFGEYSTYSLSGGTFIDGLVLSTVGPGTLFETYIPDYIDLSGKLRLGKGNLTFDGDSLNVVGNITALGGEISGDLAIVDGGQIYVGNNKDSGQRINIRHTDLTGYSELGFPIFSLVTGSAVSASPILKSGGFDDLVSGEDADPPWAAFWGFWPPIGSAATVDSTFYKHGGQSLRLYLIPGDYAVEQRAYGLIPGEEYTISAWVYSACALSVQKNELVDIWLLSASTTAGDRPNYFVSDTSLKSLIGATSVPAGVWTKLSNKFVAPAAPNIYHRIDLRTHVRSASFNVWWDSIEINKKSETSQISGFYFNDGEFLTDYLKISSDGNLIVGPIKQNTVTSGTPDPTNITDILKISGTEQDYRLWVGHIDPLKAGFNITKTGHIKTGLITSSATYNRTDTTAYVSISSGGVFGRYSSTQKIKNDIIPINNLLSSKIDESKIISGSPTINYKNILSLTPVEYSLIDYPENKKFGFLAEDVADKLPEIATYDDDGPTYFDLAGLLAATLSIVQEQQKTIEDLENRVIQLESKIGG